MTLRPDSVPTRTVVFWAGIPVPAPLCVELLARELILEPFQESQHVVQFPRGRGILFTLDGSKLSPFLRFLEMEAQIYMEAGLCIHVLASDLRGATFIRSKVATWRSQRGFNEEEMSIGLSALDDPSEFNPARVAQSFAKHQPGPIPNWDLQFDPPLSSIKLDKFELLFRKAFSDFQSIKIKSQVPGYRSPKVFMIDAIKNRKEQSYQPLPFFVKQGTEAEIRNEKGQYFRNVEGLIPVANRPALSEDRSWAELHGQGLLVSSFVEAFEPLLDAAYRRSVHKSIHLLFEEALRCWIDNGLQNGLQQNMTLYEAAGRAVPALSKISWQRTNSAKKYGATLRYADLLDLIQKLPPVRHRRSLVHGDLHANNVLLQGDRPVLIDFADVDWGPSSNDAATLEVSLVFHGYEAHADLRGKLRTSWIEFAKSTYALDSIAYPLGSRTSVYPVPVVQSGLRGIRMHGLSHCVVPEIEYPTMIAFQLLRFASHLPNCKKDSTARDLAYALAERIVLDLSRRS